MAKSKYDKENEFTCTTPMAAEVRLSIVVGEGQFSSSAFKNLNGEYVFGPVINCLLGSSDTVSGKTIRVVTTVTDTNSNTNRTSVTYQINGKNVKTYAYDVYDDHGTLFYITTIHFS